MVAGVRSLGVLLVVATSVLEGGDDLGGLRDLELETDIGSASAGLVGIDDPRRRFFALVCVSDIPVDVRQV